MKKFLKFGTLLTNEEAKKVRGGKNCPVCDCYPCICPDGGDGGGSCRIWCDQNDRENFSNVSDCERTTAEGICGSDLSKALCTCS